METKVRISVLMSVYNTEIHLVQRALNSVLKQDFQDFEIIIIDDGSDENIGEKLLKFATKYEDKITYLRHSNRTQAASINQGVMLASGEYITIIDSDDEYKPNHLSTCLLAVIGSDLIASTTETIVNKDEDYYLPDKFDPKKVIHVDNCILFATLFGKKEVFLQLKFKGNYAADADFYDRASQIFSVKKMNLRTYIYYRNIPNSVSAKKKLESIMAFESPNLYVFN